MENPCNRYLGIEKSTLLVMLTLSLLNIVIYFPSIGGYFLADDFMHISYLSHVLKTQPSLLLSNFHSNWMQAAGTQFYRPLITLSLAFDYLLWGNNAMGYHITNVLLQIGCSILTYLLIRRMTESLSEKQSKAVALFTATLFAVYPLHPEVVSWIIGRVDSVATIFYLVSFLLFLKFESNKFQKNREPSTTTNLIVFYTSLICYFCAMLSKEIAVTLPIAMFLWLLMFSHDRQSIGKKFTYAIQNTFPFWMLLTFYLLIRTISLGTLFGGYAGSVSANLDLNLLNQLTKYFCLIKLILPFNDELFSPRHLIRYLLVIIYVLGAVYFVIRQLNNRVYIIPYKLIFYAFSWIIVCLLPTYSVFYLTNNLQDSRLVYLASVPFSFLLSLFLSPIIFSAPKSTTLKSNLSTYKHKVLLDKFAHLTSLTICITILVIFAFTSYINNLPWRSAGDELRELQKALLKEGSALSPKQKIILINIPYTYNGAHMLYNGTTLDQLCSTALTVRNNSLSVITLEPVLYGDPDLLNFARLKRLLTNKNQYITFAWQRHLSPDKKTKGLRRFLNQLLPKVSGRLEKIAVDVNATNNSENFFLNKNLIENSKTEYSNLNSCDPSKFKLVNLHDLNLPTNDLGLLELSLKASPTGSLSRRFGALQLGWAATNLNASITHGFLAKPLIIDSKIHKYVFNLSEHKSWLLCKSISKLELCLSPGPYNLKVEDIRFINPSKLIPQLDADSKKGPQEDDAGTYHFAHNQGFLFCYDASKVTGAKSIYYEISKPNFWFEHEDQTFTNNRLCKNSAIRQKLPDLKGAFTIAGSDLESGYFEVHLAALDRQGKLIGLTSYPVCGQVGSP